ncbi:GTPase-activating protein S23, partial [Binucleata daphniae]
CPYNIFPTKNNDALPLSVLYTPYTATQSICDYEPVICFGCRAILNPYSEINYNSKAWSCTFCKKVTQLPDYYRDIQPEYLPLEMHDTTVEYILNKENALPPVYILLIDTCTFDIERHKLLQDAVNETLSNLPSDCLVSIIHYGTNIELFVNPKNNDEIKKTYVFSGKKEYTTEMLKNCLNKSSEKSKIGISNNLNFFFPKSEINYNPYEIRRDPFPVLNGMRPLRCTGSAISFGQSLIDFTDTGSKILYFTQGPCTFGPGTICSLFLKDGIRSHSDIVKGKANYTKSASSYYQKIALIMAEKGIGFDVIAATIEDIGIYEMKSLVDLTGGMIIMAQDFDKEIYLSSIRKYTKYVLNSKIKINVSPNIVYKAVLGQGVQTQNGWRIPNLCETTNISLLFESVNAKSEELGYIQIVTQFQKGRKLHLRVTTLSRMFNESNEKIAIGYDQEAGFILQARLYTFLNKFEEDLDLVRRIDRGLIRFVKRFATYTRENQESVILPNTMLFYPKFIYFLRRSIVVQSETNSPDETSYFRCILGREKVINALTMIVPVLTDYHYLDGINPVEMDSQSIRPDSILLLDAFCNVLIWKGEHIMQWVKDGYHLKKEFESMKTCIDQSLEVGKEIVRERLPTPQFVETHAGGSQERTLLSRVNPSRQGAMILTEDIDFETFYKCLCKIIVEA